MHSIRLTLLFCTCYFISYIFFFFFAIFFPFSLSLCPSLSCSLSSVQLSSNIYNKFESTLIPGNFLHFYLFYLHASLIHTPSVSHLSTSISTSESLFLLCTFIELFIIWRILFSEFGYSAICSKLEMERERKNDDTLKRMQM